VGPIINWNKCDGCGRCVEICPANVLALKELRAVDYNKLSLFGKIKMRAKGKLRSHVINEAACLGCKKCQTNCHERALKIAVYK
jgi:NAD-dependent dihydropyrimidine dehydrogenase PreA subunit